MIKANEARTIVNEAIEREIARRTEKAREYCEELSVSIEARANDKYTTMDNVSVDREIRAYVIAELQNNGYRAVINNNDTISIGW